MDSIKTNSALAFAIGADMSRDHSHVLSFKMMHIDEIIGCDMKANRTDGNGVRWVIWVLWYIKRR